MKLLSAGLFAMLSAWRASARCSTKTSVATCASSSSSPSSSTSSSSAMLQLRGGSVPQHSSPLPPPPPLPPASVFSAPNSPLALTCAFWMSKEDCLSSLGVSEGTGLSSDEARLRRQQYGPNALLPPPTKPLWHLVVEQFQDRLVQILLGVAVLSSALAALEKDVHALTEPLIILCILAINAGVGIWQSKSAEDSLDALKRLQPETACVLRDGAWIGEYPAADIVPGDVVHLRVGDRVPADARLLTLKTTTFSTDESTLTGESAAVGKTTDPVDAAVSISGKTNMVFGGTMVASGGAYALVTGTGMATEIGAINAGVQEASLSAGASKTPLAQKLDEFGDQLTKIIGGICLIVWVTSIPKFNSPAFGGSWVKGAIFHTKVAVALGVAAIPEGLPAVITLCLSLGTRRMARRNVIVRKLPSVETLGCTSVICTDKTGTLTTNQMTVKTLVTFSDATLGPARVPSPPSGYGAPSSAPSAAPTGDADDIEETWAWEEESESDKEPGAVGPIKASVPSVPAAPAAPEARVEAATDGGDASSGAAEPEAVADVASEDEEPAQDAPPAPPVPAAAEVPSRAAAVEAAPAAPAPAPVVSAPSPVSVVLSEREVQGVSYEPLGAIQGLPDLGSAARGLSLPGGSSVHDIAAVCALCNEAQIEYKDGLYGRIGEPTEAALKVLVEKLGAPGVTKVYEPSALARQCNDHWDGQYDKLAVLEFNRDRKSMSVLCRPRGSTGSSEVENRLFVKGAAEVVTRRCNRIKLDDGRVVPITPAIRAQLQAQCDEMARRPLRCLALAYREGRSLEGLGEVVNAESARASKVLQDASNFVHLETDMVLVGLCGIKDPARPEAAAAIARCTQAGVRIMMITGDSKETAVAIARDVNIFRPDENVDNSAFTSQEFFSLSPARQLELLRTGNKVFCRAEPKDKQVLISMLEKLGEVTAMTGDGVNDAPALKQADIGIAMGITGTEVAKSAADMILADDNFATIVSAVEEGRNIYSNMQTFVTFLISCNIGEIVTIFLATLLGIPEPLSPLHLLWVNLVTDGPPATALGFNPPDPKAMSKSPRLRSESILSRWLIVRYVITGLYVGSATVGAFVWWYQQHGVPLRQLSNWMRCTEWTDFTHSALAPAWPDRPCDIFSAAAGGLRRVPQTMSLSVLVVVELLKALSAVSLDSSLLRVQPWQNPWLLPGVLLPLALHLLVVYWPPLANVFGLAPLNAAEWRVVAAFALPVVLLEEVLKYIGRHKAEMKEAALRKLRNRHLHEFPAAPVMPPPLF